jgi:hypothetical protein
MNKKLISFGFILGLLPFGASAGIIINDHSHSSINYGSSWDDPSLNLNQVLTGLDPDGDGDIHLTLINGFAGETESWTGIGTSVALIQEIAGFSSNTTFGWYDADNPSVFGQIFSGPNGAGATASVDFDDIVHFGFYIDPNGVASDRLYTQHGLNDNNSYQAAIFAIDELPGEFIIGWEDLLLTGDSDSDYQDLIIRFSLIEAPTIITQTVSEPGSLLLMTLGLAGVAGYAMRRRQDQGQDGAARMAAA